MFPFLYLPSYALLRVTFNVIITESWLKTQQYFVRSSDTLLDKKTLLEIWLNPGLNLTTFWRTGPRSLGILELTGRTLQIVMSDRNVLNEITFQSILAARAEK